MRWAKWDGAVRWVGEWSGLSFQLRSSSCLLNAVTSPELLRNRDKTQRTLDDTVSG